MKICLFFLIMLCEKLFCWVANNIIIENSTFSLTTQHFLFKSLAIIHQTKFLEILHHHFDIPLKKNCKFKHVNQNF